MLREPCSLCPRLCREAALRVVALGLACCPPAVCAPDGSSADLWAAGQPPKMQSASGVGASLRAVISLARSDRACSEALSYRHCKDCALLGRGTKCVGHGAWWRHEHSSRGACCDRGTGAPVATATKQSWRWFSCVPVPGHARPGRCAAIQLSVFPSLSPCPHPVSQGGPPQRSQLGPPGAHGRPEAALFAHPSHPLPPVSEPGHQLPLGEPWLLTPHTIQS